MKITKTEKKKHSKQGIKSRNKTKRFHGKRIKSHTRKHRGGMFVSLKKKKETDRLLKKIIKKILEEENNNMFKVINQLEKVDDFDAIDKMIQFARSENKMINFVLGNMEGLLESIDKNIRNDSMTEPALTLLFNGIRNYLNSVNQFNKQTLKVMGIDIDEMKEDMDTYIIVFQNKIKSIQSPFHIYDRLSEADRRALIEIFKQKSKKYYSLFLDKDMVKVITNSEIEDILPFNGNENGNENDPTRMKWTPWLYHNESDMYHNESAAAEAAAVEEESGEEEEDMYRNAKNHTNPTPGEIEARAAEMSMAEFHNTVNSRALEAVEAKAAEEGNQRRAEKDAAAIKLQSAVRIKNARAAVAKIRSEGVDEEESSTFTPTPIGAVFAIGIIGGFVAILANIDE